MKDPYECPRCGYQTYDKTFMRKHLYKLKKQCPGSRNELFMTEEIKSYILQNRIYRPLEQEKQIKTIINTYNTVNNFVANMSVTNKIEKLLNHQGTELQHFEDSVENIYKNRCIIMENKSLLSPIIKLKHENFLEFIDEVSNVTTRLDKFNILYDAKLNKILLFERGTWQESLTLQGMRQIIECIKAHYLDAYECYLIRNIKLPGTNPFRRQECLDLLKDYYSFLVTFDISPYTYNHVDNEIIGEISICDNQIDMIANEFFDRYQVINDKITKGEIMKLQGEVLDIIRRNSSRNIEELNIKLMDIFRMDTNFKSTLLAKQGLVDKI
jgi:hypothetical protein